MALDLLIIGGGINGLGIAADAAGRGLSVLLVEKGDFGGGTTAASSRLIHGGLRYLQYGEFGLVRESLRERGILSRQRPHLIRPIQLLIPSYAGIGLPVWKLSIGLTAYNLLARDRLFPPSQTLSPKEALTWEPGLQQQDLRAAHAYSDSQIEFPERLCAELYRDTRAAGGEARSYTRVAALKHERGRVIGAELVDELTGSNETIEASLTINAAGPWVDLVNRLLPHPPPVLLGGTGGTHVVLPLRDGQAGPQGYLYSTARKDGRPFFLLRWDGRLLVGTTDVPFQGNPDQIAPTESEIQYLLSETNQLFPNARYTGSDVQFTTTGVRPLAASNRSAGAITRRHFLVDHVREHGIEGLVSVVGGKLTTYRSLAAETVDSCLRKLGRPHVPSTTSFVPVERKAIRNAQFSTLSEATRARLDRLYGPSAGEVADLAQEPELAGPLTVGSAVLRAEVAHAVRNEGARTAADVLYRRLMLLPPTPEQQAAVEGVVRTLDGAVEERDSR